jgi:hypothetical protein
MGDIPGRIWLGSMTYPRPLSARERAVLDFLLAGADDRLAPLRTQAKTAIVTGMCECGCPTMYLDVDHALVPAPLVSPAVESGTRQTAEMDPRSYVGVILFLEQGDLSSLELWYVSDVPPPEFPATTALEAPRITG